MLCSFIFLLVSAIVFLSGTVLLWGNKYKKMIQQLTLVLFMVLYILSLSFLIFFDGMNGSYQFLWSCNLGVNTLMPLYGHNFSFGIDGISIFFILLSTFLIPLCLLTSWKYLFISMVDYCWYFILLELFLILSFNSERFSTILVSFQSHLRLYNFKI